MASRNRFAVIGAGYVGRRVLGMLGPDQAVAYSRSDVARVCSHRLDLDRECAALPNLPGAILYTVPPSPTSSDDPRLARFLHSIDTKLDCLVYLSSSGVYGDCAGARVAESWPPLPVTARAKRRFAAEQMLQDWCCRTDTRCIIFRVPGIYGPGRLGIERIIAGESFIRESDATPGNRIHVDDLARAAIAAMTRNVPGGIYNISDGDIRSSTWFTIEVCRIAGLPPPRLISRDEALQSFAASRLSFLAESRVLETQKLRDALGFEAVYSDASTGIRASLAEDGLLRQG